MCTLTFARDPFDALNEQGGYQLFFNRDESVQRETGTSPSEAVRDGVRYLAPSDGRAGGTWLLVNEFGVSLALLNHYPGGQAEPDGEHWQSRGAIALECAAAKSVDEVRERMQSRDLELSRSFRLIACDRERALSLLWDRQELGVAELSVADLPISSSGWSDGASLVARDELFLRQREAAGAVRADWLAEFHASHWPKRGRLSVCMHGGVAATQSHSRIWVGPDVGSDQVSFEHWQSPACEAQSVTPSRLALALR